MESATFGSEFVALPRVCKELIVSLRYKLRMFGVPIDGPADVYCDNQGVVKNASIPESTLTKKHNAINYHAVREAAAAGILRVGKEDGTTNLVDLLTKVLMGKKRWSLCWNLMWYFWFWREMGFERSRAVPEAKALSRLALGQLASSLNSIEGST